MFFILSAVLLANATATTYTKIQTTVNGNTTTVESNQPGTVRVQKSDTTETIEADTPVTVTRSVQIENSQESSPVARDGTPSSTVNGPEPAPARRWMSLLRTLWDRVKKLIWFDRLTEK
ncbi:MAG: hypothetical protein UY49_C0005G0009 [Microgenomates group bacterium GW2011_GWC1_49_7]|nr:MAG: hypothetical protein UY49_C0005G0009 [Microgenomates group bacterium GW2011_GWC1_49_7]